MLSRPALVASLALACSVAVAPVARADNHAWAAAKSVLPGGMLVVGGADVNSVRASALFQKMWPALIAQSGAPADVLDAVKTTCNVDALASIDSVAVAVNDGGKGAFVIALKGLTQPQVEDCITKLAASKAGKLAIAHTGQIATYSGVGDKSFSVKWLEKSTFMVTTEPGDPSSYKAMTAGGLAKDKTFAPGLAAVKTSATAWAVVNKQEDLGTIKGKMMLGYGDASVAGGTVSANLHVVMDSDATSAAAVAEAKKQIDDAMKSGQVPPMLAGLIKALVIKTAGKEVVVSGQITETDLAMLVTMITSGGGGGGSQTAPAPPPPPPPAPPKH